MTTLAPPSTPSRLPTLGDPVYPWRGREVDAKFRWIREHMTDAVEALESNDPRDWGGAFAKLGRECDEAIGRDD